jgi:hypothetical protein
MKILRIETCPDCKYGCHTQSGSYWWCTHPEIGDHHFDVNKGIPDWCPLHDVDPTILHLLADKIEQGEAHDDLIKLAGYLEGVKDAETVRKEESQ